MTVAVGSVVTTAYSERTYIVKQQQQVLICDSPNAVAYHAFECRGLAKCTHGIVKVSESEAQRLGRRPCKICYE